MLHFISVQLYVTEVLELARSLRTGHGDIHGINHYDFQQICGIAHSVVHIIENNMERNLWSRILAVLCTSLKNNTLDDDHKSQLFGIIFRLCSLSVMFTQQEHGILTRCIEYLNYDNSAEKISNNFHVIFKSNPNHCYYIIYYCNKMFTVDQLIYCLEFIKESVHFSELEKLHLILTCYPRVKENQDKNIDECREIILRTPVDIYFHDRELSSKYLYFIDMEKEHIDFSQFLEKSINFIKCILNEVEVSNDIYTFIYIIINTMESGPFKVELISKITIKLMQSLNSNFGLYDIAEKYVKLYLGYGLRISDNYIKDNLILSLLYKVAIYKLQNIFTPDDYLFVGILESNLIDCEEVSIISDVTLYITEFFKRIQTEFSEKFRYFLQNEASFVIYFVKLYNEISIKILEEIGVEDFLELIVNRHDFQYVLNSFLNAKNLDIPYEGKLLIYEYLFKNYHNDQLDELCESMYLLAMNMSQTEIEKCDIINRMEEIYKNSELRDHITFGTLCLLRSQVLRSNNMMTDEEIRFFFFNSESYQMHENVLLKSMLDCGYHLSIILGIIFERHTTDFSKVFKNVFKGNKVEEYLGYIRENIHECMEKLLDLNENMFEEHDALLNTIRNIRYIYYYCKYCLTIDGVELNLDRLIELIFEINTQIRDNSPHDIDDSSEEDDYDDYDEQIIILNNYLNKNLKCILQYLKNKGDNASIFNNYREYIYEIISIKEYYEVRYDLMNFLYAIPEGEEIQRTIYLITEFLENDPCLNSTKYCLEYLITLNIDYYNDEIFQRINNLYDHISDYTDLLTILLAHIDVKAERVSNSWYPDYIINVKISTKYANQYFTFLQNIYKKLSDNNQIDICKMIERCFRKNSIDVHTYIPQT